MDNAAKIPADLASQELREARVGKGYSHDDLAVATDLTVTEIAATEEDNAVFRKDHFGRIRNVHGF